jgi:plastocyanin
MWSGDLLGTTMEITMLSTAVQLRKLSVVGAFGVVFPLLAATPAAADDVTINMKTGPNRYQEKVVQVKVGDHVMWKNLGGTHTATPDPGQIEPFPDTGNVPLNGTSTPWVVGGSARTINYHCAVHGAAMTGQIIVLP